MIAIISVVWRLHGVTIQKNCNLKMDAKHSSRNVGNYIQEYMCHYPENHLLSFMEFYKYDAWNKHCDAEQKK
jgi:hypothetical protein